jgi:hypothetical protein
MAQTPATIKHIPNLNKTKPHENVVVQEVGWTLNELEIWEAFWDGGDLYDIWKIGMGKVYRVNLPINILRCPRPIRIIAFSLLSPIFPALGAKLTFISSRILIPSSRSLRFFGRDTAGLLVGRSGCVHVAEAASNTSAGRASA